MDRNSIDKLLNQIIETEALQESSRDRTSQSLYHLTGRTGVTAHSLLPFRATGSPTAMRVGGGGVIPSGQPRSMEGTEKKKEG